MFQRGPFRRVSKKRTQNWIKLGATSVKIKIFDRFKRVSMRFNDQGVIADCQRDAVDVV